ncbi:MAG: Holliday junction branch migration protein RuvA [Phycisphaerae bacterium]
MISHITGQLTQLNEDSVIIERDGIGFTVLTPRYAIGELAPYHNREVTLHTLLFLDGSQSGNHLEPQLVGFPHAQDKLFFRRFISVKGFGPKKTLNALTQPVSRVAGWIEQGDTKALKELPGIGTRAAELIVAELRGKMQDIALAGGGRPADPSRLNQDQRDALDIMVSLGDGRIEAEQWLERAGDEADNIDTPQDWIRAAYRVKTGVH